MLCIWLKNTFVIHFHCVSFFQTVKEGLKKVCKCHGVSGSCTNKTCWKQLAPFTETSLNLKKKYDHAVKAQAENNWPPRRKRLHGRKRKNRKYKRARSGNRIPMNSASNSAKKYKRRRSRAIMNSHSSRALLYLSDSPDFCSNSTFSLGTSGRECERGDNCRSMCCGRGHNVQIRVMKSSCKCRVVWCCQVKCQTCVERKEIYTCKWAPLIPPFWIIQTFWRALPVE